MSQPSNQGDIQKYDVKMRSESEAHPGVTWLSPGEAGGPLRLVGFAWFEQDGVYRRLPVKPSHPIREPVDNLADCCAGGQIRFRTDSTRVVVRATLKAPDTMYHMPATGQCGFDCYVGPVGAARYVGTTKNPRGEQSYECALFENAPREERVVTINFPLYQGVREVAVGVDEDAAVAPPPDTDGPERIVVYGTSITQGGCASRPGMAYTNILSRRINREFINLGFSGNGRGEPEVARIVAELDRPCLVVLDFEANVKETETLRERFPVFVEILRETWPETPIVCLSRPPSAKETVNEDERRLRLERKAFQRETVESLRAAGDGRVSFIDGETLMGGEDWFEGYVDGVHPTDLGFLRMADALEPAIRDLI